VDIGRSVFRPRALRFLFVIGRLLMTPLGFYRWMNTPRKGAGNQLFSCVTPSFRELSESECEVELKLSEGYEPDRVFFLLTKGSFVEAPTLFGYGAASVELAEITGGARYRVSIPTRTSFWRRARDAVSWPFAARAAARELKAANEDLVERYEQ